MGIKVKTDLEWGHEFYLKSDPEQFKHLLVEVIIVPAGKDIQLKFGLSYNGEIIRVFDFECTTTPDYPLPSKIDDEEE